MKSILILCLLSLGFTPNPHGSQAHLQKRPKPMPVGILRTNSTPAGWPVPWTNSGPVGSETGTIRDQTVKTPNVHAGAMLDLSPPVPAALPPKLENLTWDASPTPGVSYLLLESTNGGASYSLPFDAGQALSVSIPQLPGTNYVVAVARLGAIQSDVSNILEIDHKLPPPPMDHLFGFRWRTNSGPGTVFADASPYWIGSGFGPYTNTPPNQCAYFRIMVQPTNGNQACWIQSNTNLNGPFVNTLGPYVMPGLARQHFISETNWSVARP